MLGLHHSLKRNRHARREKGREKCETQRYAEAFSAKNRAKVADFIAVAYGITPYPTSRPTGGGCGVSSFVQSALQLTKHGLRVFPLIVKGKAPATPHGCKDAATDPKVTRAWWKQNPAFNIAIATGNGIGVADTDGPDGEAWLVEQGDLPPTWTSLTARGMHRYYAIPAGLRSRTGFGPHVDFKAESGYVVAPPSIHPDGPRYRWKKGHAPWEIPLAPIPPWRKISPCPKLTLLQFF